MIRTLLALCIAVSLSAPAISSACAMRVMDVDPAVVAKKAPQRTPVTPTVVATTQAEPSATQAQTEPAAATVAQTPEPVPTAAAPAPTGLVTAMAELDALVSATD